MTATHVRSILLKVVAHQFVQAFVTCCVLHETCLITETVMTIDATAMEMRLQITVAAVGEITIFVEAKFEVSRWDRFIFEDFEISTRPIAM